MPCKAVSDKECGRNSEHTLVCISMVLASAGLKRVVHAQNLHASWSELLLAGSNGPGV